MTQVKQEIKNKIEDMKSAIFDALIDASKEGKLIWETEIGDRNGDRFVCKLPKSNTSISVECSGEQPLAFAKQGDFASDIICGTSSSEYIKEKCLLLQNIISESQTLSFLQHVYVSIRNAGERSSYQLRD